VGERRERVFDVGVAVVCYLATVALPVKAMATADWSLFALAALASGPLVWRRRHPLPVAAVVGVGTLGLAATGIQNHIPLPYGQLVATYTVAMVAPPVWRVIAAATTGAGLAVAVLVLLGQRPSVLATAALPFVVAYATGAAMGARRDRITLLEQRAAEEAEAVAVRERERIAREIHDIVAHSVTLMVVQAESGAVLAGDRDRARAAFETISATGREAVAQLDRALGVLRADEPSRRPAPGLGELPALVARTRSAGLDASLVVRGLPVPVPGDLAAAVYRIIQEALTNAVKHARAGRVTVALEWRDEELAVVVRDDGRRSDPRAAAPARLLLRPRGTTAAGDRGRGLAGMRERIRAFGGTLQAGPDEDGPGFRVRAVLPLPGSGPADG
jgi:signal transduction histidine kinase